MFDFGKSFLSKNLTKLPYSHLGGIEREKKFYFKSKTKMDNDAN